MFVNKIKMMENIFMKILLAVIFLQYISFGATAQSKYIDREGKASFFSEAPIEDIDAHSNKVMTILDLRTGNIAATVMMKSFEFKKSLMQVHFNENYVESEKFPKALFKGKIENFDKLDLSEDGKSSVDISGEITIHGVTQPLKCRAILNKKASNLTATTSFPIKVADFDIEIPKVVFYNIAEIVEVKLSFSYQPLNP